MLFNIRLADDGSIEFTEHDTLPGTLPVFIQVPGLVFGELGLFDESRKTFESYEQDSELAADLCEMALALAGWTADVFQRQSLRTAVEKLCSPGPGYEPGTIPGVHLKEVA